MELYTNQCVKGRLIGRILQDRKSECQIINDEETVIKAVNKYKVNALPFLKLEDGTVITADEIVEFVNQLE